MTVDPETHARVLAAIAPELPEAPDPNI